MVVVEEEAKDIINEIIWPISIKSLPLLDACEIGNDDDDDDALEEACSDKA